MAGIAGWPTLPDEILIQILTYLEPCHIAQTQRVSRRLYAVCVDDDLWKQYCFDASPWYQSLQTRRSKHQRFSSTVNGLTSFGNDTSSHTIDSEPPHLDNLAQWRSQRAQDMSNWDPVFPDEKVSWYNEFIQRAGPACVNWFQTPRINDRGIEAIIEARGVALYHPGGGDNDSGTTLAVSPLDDGSVCLWDVNGTRARKGGILESSRKGILFYDGPSGSNSQRSKRIDTGVTECVSVNHRDNKAFFAVQSHLIEVDLERLDIVSRESFEWSITTLSQVHNGVPLTVGTSLGIHLHDFRAKARVRHDAAERVDYNTDMFKAIFDPNPLPPCASLSQPTPVSILHLPQAGSASTVSDDIYVSGRFSNILHYDRRKFPAIADSIYSGAWINSLAALPFPFSRAGCEARRQGVLTGGEVTRSKSGTGQTLIAGGGYKQKGSLELYGLASAEGSATYQTSHLENRYTAASSTILSVANHGSRIVFSDGSGFIKWFERDAMTECRRLKIGHSDSQQSGSLFASMPASDDLARKIICTGSSDEQRPNHDNILFWTGEKLGMVSFTTARPFKPKDFEPEDEVKSANDAQRQDFVDRTRTALEQQADEAKFLSGLTWSPGAAR